jgi:hypothetical protein
VQSRPVGSSDCLDAGAHGWNIEDLIGSPLLGWACSGSAHCWVLREQPFGCFLQYRIIQRSHTGSLRAVWWGQGWVVSRWVFEI